MKSKEFSGFFALLCSSTKFIKRKLVVVVGVVLLERLLDKFVDESL